MVHIMKGQIAPIMILVILNNDNLNNDDGIQLKYSDELFPSQEIEGGYLETYAITPIIFIENINFRNKEDIFKITTRKKIYDQIFVLARAYLYLDNTKNHICF